MNRELLGQVSVLSGHIGLRHWSDPGWLGSRAPAPVWEMCSLLQLVASCVWMDSLVAGQVFSIHSVIKQILF